MCPGPHFTISARTQLPSRFTLLSHSARPTRKSQASEYFYAAELRMSSAFNKFSSAPGAAHYHHDHRQRIPQQQGVGQTLPPMPVGSEPHNTPPPPPGAMSPGTHVVVGRHKVVIQVYLAEGKPLPERALSCDSSIC